MAGGAASSNASRQRKRVEAESDSSSPSLKRARDGSAFTKCEECNKDVAVALISFHNCSLDAKIKMNLEAQVVETETKKKAPVEKKKAKPSESKGKETKPKNSNGKKRPQTAFFLFMADYRKLYKEANPDCKKVSMAAKEAGEKWKSMSDEEKKTYTDKAAELKAEYNKESEPIDLENEEEEEVGELAENEVKDETDDLTDEEVKDETNDSSEKEIKEEADDLADDEVKEKADDLDDGKVKEEADDE